MKPAPTETLEQVFDQISALWTGAVRDRRSPLHTPMVCSVADDMPAPRIMVLREVAADIGRFRFHTDVRSPKADQIAHGAPLAILAYDPEARIQLTVRGTGRIERSGETVEQAWSAAAPSSRRCYLAAHAPGTPLDSCTSGIPENLLDRAPSLQESEAGRGNFGVLLIEARELEWLKLTSCGNRRAAFHRSGEDWHGHWIAP